MNKMKLGAAEDVQAIYETRLVAEQREAEMKVTFFIMVRTSVFFSSCRSGSTCIHNLSGSSNFRLRSCCAA